MLSLGAERVGSGEHELGGWGLIFFSWKKKTQYVLEQSMERMAWRARQRRKLHHTLVWVLHAGADLVCRAVWSGEVAQQALQGETCVHAEHRAFLRLRIGKSSS